MKLNLLPTTEKKSRQGKTAIIIGGLIVVASLFGAAALTLIPKAALETSKDGIDGLESQVVNLDAKSKYADTVIAQAEDVLRDASLAQAMIDHNAKYPALYDEVKKVIPPYFRIQSMTAAPISINPTAPPMSQITLTGTLRGYQRYADLMFGLMRFKDAISISRSGYNLNDPMVPSLSPDDQVGRMRRPTEAAIPDDGLARLAYFEAQGASSPRGFLNVNGFGTNEVQTKGALPDSSIITVTMVVSRDLSTPLPATTLRAGGGPAAAGGAQVPGLGGAAGAAGVGAPGPAVRPGAAGPGRED